MKRINQFFSTILACAMIISGAMTTMFAMMWTAYYVMEKYLWHDTKLSYKDYMKEQGIDLIKYL